MKLRDRAGVCGDWLTVSVARVLESDSVVVAVLIDDLEWREREQLGIDLDLEPDSSTECFDFVALIVDDVGVDVAVREAAVNDNVG